MTNKQLPMMSVKGGWVAKAQPFTVEATSQVDSQTWYTVSVTKDVSIWIRDTYKDREDDLWYEHINTNTWMLHKNKFDIHEKVYTMLSLRWS